jgi:hypothetical protein
MKPAGMMGMLLSWRELLPGINGEAVEPRQAPS